MSFWCCQKIPLLGGPVPVKWTNKIPPQSFLVNRKYFQFELWLGCDIILCFAHKEDRALLRSNLSAFGVLRGKEQ